MFRVLYAIVLTALVALPHDMCFCDLIHAALAEFVELHDDDSAPDEHECSCKLLEAMPLPQTDNTDGATQADLLLIADPPFLSTKIFIGAVSTISTHTSDAAALIPCALRI